MQIEDERDKAMVEATVYLVTSLQHNGDLPKKVQESTTASFQKNVANIEKQMEKDYQKELGDVFKRLSAKNKVSDGTGWCVCLWACKWLYLALRAGKIKNAHSPDFIVFIVL